MESAIYKKNKKILNSYIESYRKQITTLKKKIPKYENSEEYDDMNKLPLMISCIPTAVASLPVLAGSLGVAINLVGIFIAAFAEVPPSTIDNLSLNAEKCVELAKNHLTLLAGTTILPGTIFAGMQAKDAIGKKKREQAEEMKDSLEQMIKCSSLIYNLRYHGYNEINFIRNILSNVDISRNDKSFNTELLETCYDYVESPDSENFEQLFEFLAYSTSDRRASKSFRQNEYLKTLVNWYNKEYLSRASLDYNKRILEKRLERQQKK